VPRAPGRHERDEQTDDLITDELLDDRVTLDQDPARLSVEAVHQSCEIDHRHLSGELARASDVGEQHRDLSLSATDLLAPWRARTHLRVALEPLEAAPADLRLLLPRLEPVASQEQPARRAERSLAELASGFDGIRRSGLRSWRCGCVPLRNSCHSSSGDAYSAMRAA